jgi:lipoic acid synthetase
MVLGNICTRRCGFCAVPKGEPTPVDDGEPERVAMASARLGLRHVVVTSVNRDDLPDGGATHIARTVEKLRAWSPEVTVEVLVPDFGGSVDAVRIVLHSGPDFFNHNLETVPRLYERVRPLADYGNSLRVLKIAKEEGVTCRTKSGLMVGLGEREEEVIGVMRNLREVGCDILTLGQYLQPGLSNLPVVEYVPHGVFRKYREAGEALGFKKVFAGPWVRSSFMAEQVGKGL